MKEERIVAPQEAKIQIPFNNQSKIPLFRDNLDKSR